MNRTIFLLFALLAAGGFWLAYQWDDIRVMLGAEPPPEALAVKMAREGFALERARTNEEVIRSRLQAEGSAIEAVGWHGEAKTPPFYLVTFKYRDGGEEWTYYFEVDVETAAVRDAGADPELVEKYRIPIGRIR